MTIKSSSWTRLSYSPATGRLTAEGDPHAVLGKTATELYESGDPLSLLPDSVSEALTEGVALVRDTALSLVIVPGDTRYSNNVTVIKEDVPEYDLISDLASGVAALTPDGTILRWNRRMSFLFGPRERDVRGRNVQEVLPSPVLYNWTSVLSSVRLGHEVKIEFPPSVSKKVIGILTRGGPGAIGVFLDSTENYNTARRLRAINRLNQAYLQSTGTGLILLDDRLRILLSNPGFQRISGQGGSLIGLQLHDVLPEESYRWVHDASERLLAEDRSEQTGMVPFTGPDGGRLFIRHTLRAVLNEMNQPVNFVCLFEDRTELFQLREKVDELRLFVSGIADLSSNATGFESTAFNTSIRAITGSSAVLRFVFDSAETLKLQGVYGNWPSSVRKDEPEDLGFPAAAWSGEGLHVLEGSELGNLSSSFSRCVLIPLGSGIHNSGFILLCDPSETGSDRELLTVIASIAGMVSAMAGKDEEPAGERRKKAADPTPSLLFDMTFPAAMFERGGEMVFSNPAMERLTGIRAGEFVPDDLPSIIDPGGNGYTLDSLASSGLPEDGSGKMIWSFLRRDGQRTLPHRWTISIIENARFFKGDYGFLVTAVPVPEIGEALAGGGSGLMSVEALRTFMKIIAMKDTGSVLRSIAGICLLQDSQGRIEFLWNGETVASFGSSVEAFPDSSWQTGPPLLLEGREYETRYTGGISMTLLESACETLSSLRGTVCTDNRPAVSDSLEKVIGSLMRFVREHIVDSIGQSGAVLSFAEPSDPFSGFARTVLLAAEAAEEAAGYLETALTVSRERFRIVSLERFLSGFYSSFTEKGLRPPVLSIEDRLPDVLIVPEAILFSITSLCSSRASDSLVYLSTSSSSREEHSGAVITVSGLEPALTMNDLETGYTRLSEGVFDASAELAVIAEILEASGCRITALENGEMQLFFRYAHL